MLEWNTQLDPRTGLGLAISQIIIRGSAVAGKMQVGKNRRWQFAEKVEVALCATLICGLDVRRPKDSPQPGLRFEYCSGAALVRVFQQTAREGRRDIVIGPS